MRRVKLRDRLGASEGAERIRFTSSILLMLGPEDAEPGCSAADPLSARGLDGRFPGGARGAAGPRCPEPVAVGASEAAGRVGGGLCALAAARFVGPALRVCLGRRCLPAGTHGATGRVHPGADRRDARGQEGTGRLPGGHAGECKSWRELLVDLKARGLAIAPELATGDGGHGFWKAIDEVSPTTRHQRCTAHKTANVLDKLPKSVQPAAKADLREIWTAPDRATAETAIGSVCREVWGQIREGGHLPGQGPRRAA